MELEISNVINVSVSEAPQGLGEYNTSNVALFTAETYDSDDIDDTGYLIALSPDSIADAFGTDSTTYKMAVALFSQRPNILANSGYLVVIPYIVEVQNIALSGIAASGTFKLNFAADITAFINWNDTAAQIQAAIRTLTGLEAATVSGSIASQNLVVTFHGYYGDAALITASNNTLATSAPAGITFNITQTVAGEGADAAITRTKDLVQYFASMSAAILSQAQTLAEAAVIETLNKMAVYVSRTEADIDPGGTLDLLTTGNFHKNRGLYYGAETDLEALQMMAAYVGRGFSTNFGGNNTTQTMHLKDLVGIQPDPSMTQTILEKAKDAGADTYISIQGVAKVFCSGANHFFDQVYNLGWYVGAIQIALFNVLAQTSTKIIQTEDGVGLLKGAARKVSQQGVINQYLAPGVWTLPNTFGNQEDFYNNIAQVGYYIYSTPIALQSQSARDARESPLIQIAAKEAGAIHSASVIININA